ncbi:Surp module [Phytophthora infestans]|uniref:Surp module n=1 Tax=Phytophthora infestans TaxID=4787 RepID=A0A8S9U1U0_PHYIN|nr:Surp module [Phytophthora infestans]
MTSAQLEQQFQARIAQAKEAARLASVAVAARAHNRSNAPPFASIPAVPDAPFRPPPIPQASSRFAVDPEPLAIENAPPDVKKRIDRLVEFVARNGDAFEATAKERERDNPNFAFLKPGGPYSDYYQARKQQVCRSQPPQASPTMVFARSPPPTGSPNGPTPVQTDLLDMSVGAMANVCNFARTSGVQAYEPIPREVILHVGSLPPVEPARLESRLSGFYRDEGRVRPRES